jgi:hypothetical protein
MSDFLKIQSLIQEGFSCLGMLNEAQSKCCLIKNRIENDSLNEDFDPSPEISQISADIDTYSNKLFLLKKELRSYGAIC